MSRDYPAVRRPSFLAGPSAPFGARTCLRILATGTCLSGLTALPALSQTVRGVLLEEGTDRPIAGGFIILLGEEGQRLGRDIGTLSDEDGRFMLRVPGPGRYRLRAERIGFRSTLSGPIELATDETLEVTLVAPIEAVELAALAVTGKRECDVPPDVGRETAVLWEEARKALSVVDWGTQRVLRYQVLRWEREFGPRARRVRNVRTWPGSWNARGSLFTTRPAADLAEHGYVRPLPADSFVFYAPDASVVLSESFADQHCFALQVGRGDREGQIGLGFEPAPGRDLPDIEGVLWLDRESAELRDLEFRYTNLPLPVWSDHIGGGMEFERLPSGAWIISRWWIRSPIVELAEPLNPLGGRHRLAAIREDGGTVVDLRYADGRPLKRWLGTALTGSVFDSVRAEPLAGATVFLVGTERATETDENGRFQIDGLLEGEYAVNFSHPVLDSLAFTPEPVEITLRRDGAAAVRLAVPSLSSIVASLCPDTAGRERTGVVVGVVRDSNSDAPVAGAHVAVFTDRLEAETRSDGMGRYAACGPVRKTLTVVAWHETRASDETSLILTSRRITRKDLVLRRVHGGEDRWQASEVDVTRGQAGATGQPAVVVGRLLDAESRKPIDLAEIRLVGQGGDLFRVTDGEGTFLFPRVSPGVYEVLLTHLAYGTHSDSLEVGNGELVRYDVRLAMEPIELEPLVATVDRRSISPMHRGFYERMSLDMGGYFITREDIERRQPHRISQMIGEAPGVRVRCPMGVCYVYSTRYRDCRPAVYLDRMYVTGGKNSDAPPWPLDRFVIPNEVEAVEVYEGPASLPAEFSGSRAGCGVIVIWTRRGS